MQEDVDYENINDVIVLDSIENPDIFLLLEKHKRENLLLIKSLRDKHDILIEENIDLNNNIIEKEIELKLMNRYLSEYNKLYSLLKDHLNYIEKDLLDIKNHFQSRTSSRNSTIKKQQTAKKTLRKDVKKPVTSFSYFYSKNYKEIQSNSYPIQAKNLLSILSVKWRQLTKEEKKPYEDLAEEDRKRYYNEMKNK